MEKWRWRAILGSVCARFSCTALLFIAAILKTHQLFTDPALGVVHGSRWLQAGLVEYELLLAIWLLSGVSLLWGRRIVLLTFIGFGCYAFFLGMSGKASCGCFGRAHVNPWWTFGMDATLALLLLTWKPRCVTNRLETRRAFLVLTVAFAVTSSLMLSVLVWRPSAAASLDDALADSPFVLLEPEKWIGQPFPLTKYIDMAERERLSRGSWIVVFYRRDCSKCQRILPQYERLATQQISEKDEPHIALIEVPPRGSTMFSVNPLCYLGRLSDGKEWLITTPSEVRVMDGRVTAATSELVPRGP